MAYATPYDAVDIADPLEVVESFARRSDMEAQRIDDHELHVNLTGSWRDVGIWFGWRMDTMVMQIGAPLEMRVPNPKLPEVLRLLAMVNEQLVLGHFDLGHEEQGLLYRNSAVLPLGEGLDDSQAEILVRGAMDAFERYYPAFNFVIWGNKSADEALGALMLETVGTA